MLREIMKSELSGGAIIAPSGCDEWQIALPAGEPCSRLAGRSEAPRRFQEPGYHPARAAAVRAQAAPGNGTFAGQCNGSATLLTLRSQHFTITDKNCH